MAEKTEREVPYITLGSTLLDLVVGGGKGMGIPAGRVVNIVGDKSAGKSFLCAEAVAHNHHAAPKKFRFNYDDGETGFTFDTQELYGMDIMPEGTLSSRTVEEMDANVGRFCAKAKAGQYGIYVVDSLDGLSDEEKEAQAAKRMKQSEDGDDVKNDGSYGMGAAKFLSQHFFKTRVPDLEESNTLLVIVSQVRENLEPMSYQKYVRSGGKALDFYCHTVIWLSNVAKIKRGERVVGLVVHAKTTKSKTPRPYRECTFSLYFNYGVDNIGSNLDWLYGLRGKDGQLLSKAQNIPWSDEEGMQDTNLPNLLAFLKENGADARAREDKKKDTGKPQLSVDWTTEWLAKPEQADLAPAFKAKFGQPCTRAELIRRMEEDPKLAKELERRVIAKWEALEKEAAGEPRRSKFA